MSETTKQIIDDDRAEELDLTPEERTRIEAFAQSLLPLSRNTMQLMLVDFAVSLDRLVVRQRKAQR